MEDKLNYISHNEKNFIKELWPLVGHDDSQIYGKASREDIEKIITNFGIRNSEGNKYEINTNTNEFIVFSPGIFLMFKILKFICALFSVICLISLAQLVILLKSSSLKEEEDSFRVALMKITLASIEPDLFNLYYTLDIVSVVVILAGLIWWSEKLRDYVKEANSVCMLPSFITLELSHIPNYYSEEGLLESLSSKDLKPEKICTAMNYSRFLDHYTNLTDFAINLRIFKEIFDKEDQEIDKHLQAKRLLLKFLSLKREYCKIKEEQFNNYKFEPTKVFVVMKSYSDLQKVLENNPNEIINFCKKKENFDSYQFTNCQVEPEAIIWENIGISKLEYLLRAFIVFVILSFFTLIGILIIYLLEIFLTASIGDLYYFSEKSHKVEENILHLESSSSNKESTEIKVENLSKLIFLILLTPFVIFVCKKVLMGTLSHFVHFRKYISEISRIKSQTIILTFYYFIVIGVLHLLLYLKIESKKGTLSFFEILEPLIIKLFDITNYNPSSIHLISDFSFDWYEEVTFFIVYICSISFNVTNIFKLLLSKFSFYLQKKKTTKQKTLYEANKCLKGVDLHMENTYASMNTIFLFFMLYGCSFPIISFFCLINTLVLFYCTKWNFINYVTKPKRMGHSINRTCTNILLIGVVLHCFMAPIFLGAPRSSEHEDEEKVLTVWERYYKHGSIYFSIGCFTILYLLFRKSFRKNVICPLYKIYQKYRKTSMLESEFPQSEIKETFDEVPSYEIESNERYAEILKNIHILKNSTEPVLKTSPETSSFEESEEKSNQLFQEILEISRHYLDKEKNTEIYEEIEELAESVGFGKLTEDDNQVSAERTINYEIHSGSDDIIEGSSS